MADFDFTLRFRLPPSRPDAEEWLGSLQAAGCEDATVGVGRPGRIALDFTRHARTADIALATAVRDVKRAIPGAVLVEAAPDYVGVADIAVVIGVSRQRVRALIEDTPSFPLPVHEGTSALFHLAPVLEWLADRSYRSVNADYLEVARATMRVNLARAMELSGHAA